MRIGTFKNAVLALTAIAFAVELLQSNANAATAVVPTWTKVSNMTVARENHTATRLADGRVLVTGGATMISPSAFDLTNSCEIYDPQDNSWQPAASMNTARWAHQATLLTNGKVLVVEGFNPFLPGNASINSAELYDPATDSWTYTGPPVFAFSGAGIVRLNDGRVYSASGQIYDPSLNTWTQAPGVLRAGKAALLSNGKVMILPGGSGFGGFLYDPAANTLTATAQRDYRIESGHALVALADGRALVTSGYNLELGAIYNPDTDTWQPMQMPYSRNTPRVVRLHDDRILMIGGGGRFPGEYTADIFNPVTNTWAPTADMQWPREVHSATVLQDGRVLVTGGSPTSGVILPTAEIYDESTLANLVEGGRRPSVDAFLSWSGTYLASVHSMIPTRDNIVLFLVTGTNGETVFPATAGILWNDVDVTPSQLPAQGVTPLRLPVTQVKNLILSSVNGLVPGSQRTAADTDRIVLESTMDIQPFDQP